MSANDEACDELLEATVDALNHYANIAEAHGLDRTRALSVARRLLNSDELEVYWLATGGGVTLFKNRVLQDRSLRAIVIDDERSN